jgi:hypothetical protein
MKKILFCLIIALTLSCSKENETIEELPIPPTTNQFLTYPTGTGTSGDPVTGVLGYGYMATGLMDTLSVRSKVLNLSDPYYYSIYPLSSSGPGYFFSGKNYQEFLSPKPNLLGWDGLKGHIKKLMELSFETIESTKSYAYYSHVIYSKRGHFYVSSSCPDNLLTSEFLNDITALSPEQLVNKYGTHVLISVFYGTRFEAVYKGNVSPAENFVIQKSMLNRMSQLLGATNGIALGEPSSEYTQSDEEIVFNSLGSAVKIFQTIKVTDNNPDQIYINQNELYFENVRYQFIDFDIENGIKPLYHFVNDPEKKEILKNYIALYLLQH